MEILIFKTNIEKAEQVNKVKSLFTPLQTIKDWSFDLEDCDKILRIVAHNVSPLQIETMVRNAGFYCSELAD